MTFIVFMSIVFFILVLLFVCSLCVGGDYAFSKGKMQIIRAVIPTVIVLHHCALYFDVEALFPLKRAGNYLISVFFFISGYGVESAINNKANYLTSFWKKRGLSIMIPYIISLVLYFVVYILIHDGQFNFKNDIVDNFKNSGTFLSYSWFIYVIIICYFVFYVCHRYFFSCKVSMLLETAILLFVALSMWLLDMGHWWYNKILVFALGGWFYLWEPFLRNIFRGHRASFYISIICLVIISFILSIGNKGYLLPVSLLFFSAAVYFCISLIPWTADRNKIIIFLSSISYEIYLVQGIVLYLLRGPVIYIANDMIFILLSIINIVLLALGVHKISELCHKYLL